MKNQHSFGFQALNQARSACHAKANFDGYRALVVSDPSLSIAFGRYAQFFGTARKAMHEMAIVNVASVLDIQPNSSGMSRLIKDIKKHNPNLEDLITKINARLEQHHATYKKAVLIRSNIIAHRSRQLTYRQVHEKANLSDEELESAITTWCETANQVAMLTRGESWQVTYETGSSATRLLKDLAVTDNRPRVE